MPEREVRYCTTDDGVRIAYFSAGRGPAIVFASNIWGDANMYAAPHPHTRYMTDRLVELGWQVVRYDLRGMGSSQRDVDDLSLEARVLDLQAVVDHLSLQRLAVAGVNSAAAVAMAFAAGNRNRVSHVVVLNGWAFAPEMQARSRVANAIASMRSLAEEDWEFFTLALAKLVTELDDPVHTQRYAETIRRSSSAKAHEAFWRAVDQMDLRPILPALEMPVLVVHDTGYPFGSFELCQDLAASLPDARFVVIAADRDAEIDAIDTFLRGGSDEPAQPQPAGAVRTGMFTDAVDAMYAAQPTMAAPAVQPQSFSSGRYVVSKLLGEGGQKTVFLARDTQLGRDVAVALLKAEGLDEAGLARLLREAQAMARLEAQPNIVAIYDIGEHEGRPFTVCEYLAGGTLEQELARASGALPAERAVAIARDVCRALVVAHGSDIIHRDIKPSNVWLTGAGRAKLGDFGLATALDRSRVTQAGTIMGTAAYMAPEQALGGEIDQRSDLYSLGCVLYEMLTGRPPFVADTAVAVVSQHINASPVAPSELQPALPRALERLVMRMLAKSGEDRPQTAAEVLAELEGKGLAGDAPRTTRSATVIEPQIRYCTTEDGVSIAYWTLGEGTPLVYMPDGPWSHLTVEWQQPESRRWYEALAEGRMVVRYDGRGTGLSERKVSEFSLETMMRDLEAVVGQLPPTPFDLYAITGSGQVAISYAVRHPESVSHLVLWLCTARAMDWLAMPQSRALGRMGERDWELFTETAARFAVGWEQEEFARSVAAAMRAAVTPDTMAAVYDAIRPLDVSNILSEVRAATLVLHRREFRWQTIEIPKRLAAAIPGARMVVLEGSAGAPFLENADQALETVDNFLRSSSRIGERFC